MFTICFQRRTMQAKKPSSPRMSPSDLQSRQTATEAQWNRARNQINATIAALSQEAEELSRQVEHATARVAAVQQEQKSLTDKTDALDAEFRKKMAGLNASLQRDIVF